jgi:DNA polymerase-3 subunit alpha (Gram-positive type)
MKSFTVVDLETTGFSAVSDSIIEIGAISIRDGVIVERYSQLINPCRDIPYKIQTLTGITNEMVKGMPTIEEPLLYLYDMMRNYPVVGHNVRFDMRFLQVKGEELGIDFSLNDSRYGVDTLSLSRSVLKNEKSHKLVSVAKCLGVLNENAHRALDDCEMTLAILEKLGHPEPSQLFMKGRATEHETLAFK